MPSTLFGYPIEDYDLPERMDGWNVLDIGSHAGTTAYQFLKRGAAKVRCFEPGLPQIIESRKNLAEFGDRVEINHMAVWRSGEYEPVEYVWCKSCPGTSVSYSSQLPTALKTVGLDALVVDAKKSGYTIDLAKIDIEGSEYPVLYSSQLLSSVKRLRIEIHDFVAMGVDAEASYGGLTVNKCTIDSMLQFLESRGYNVRCVPNGNNYLFLVSAERKN